MIDDADEDYIDTDEPIEAEIGAHEQEVDDLKAEWSHRRMAVISAIRLHYETYGATNWKLVREKFPELKDRNFWRIVRKVKNGIPDTDILEASVAYAKRMLSRDIPAPVSPAIIYSNPREVREAIDYMSHIEEMLDDIKKLREFSLGKADDDGGRPIQNPMYFAQAVKLRGETLDRLLKAYETVYDMRKMKEFYDTIIHEVAIEDPEVAGRIMERLKILNDQRGMTLDAKIAIGARSGNGDS